MPRPMTASPAIDSLLASAPQLWRGREPNRSQRTLSTGHARLDKRLPGGGWPLGAVTELIADTHGLGEFSLLFPTLAELSHKGEWLVLIDPPWIPYPAALQGQGLALDRLLLVRTANAKESLWACEQALQGSRGGAVLAWPELIGPEFTGPEFTSYRQISFARLRRLQLAAEAGAKPAFLFRPEDARKTASPAALRLHLQGTDLHPHDPAHNPAHMELHNEQHGGTRIEILKSRGQQTPEPLWLPSRHPVALRQTRLMGSANSERARTPTLPGQQPVLPATAVISTC